MIQSDELSPFLQTAINVYKDYSYCVLNKEYSSINKCFISWFFSLDEAEQDDFVVYVNRSGNHEQI